MATNAQRDEVASEPSGEIWASRPLVVGIGASAGGLDAYKTFFSKMPVDSGISFVLVQHLAPDHDSMLAELVGAVTTMPVTQAIHDETLVPNHIYVIPPDATLTLKGRKLQVARPAPARDRRPINTFFVSLAEQLGEEAVCIVLSGTGSDGASGLTSVKEHGGLTIAQAGGGDSAMAGMPRSAEATGDVDHSLAIESMPAKLLAYQQHLSKAAGSKDADGTRTDTSAHLSTIGALLRLKVGHDFRQYKEKTVVRRIQRRMQVLQTDTVAAYIAHLRDTPQEPELLFRELLIGVTRFFRDPVAFEALRTTAIAMTLDEKMRGGGGVRVWVPACATGEEVYSLAILLSEEMERRGQAFPVQIFGTDIDDRAVATARAARYGEPMEGMSAERIARWWVEDRGEWSPIRSIREMCVFSVHSLVKDPPFSKVDLISCRNLLIYLDSDLQDRVMRTFHYALRPEGKLFLGASEGLARAAKLFVPLDAKNRVFRRRDADVAFPGASLVSSVSDPHRSPAAPRDDNASQDWLDKSVHRALERYSPVYVIIDKDHEILRFSGGEVGRYLEPSRGAASLNLFNILRKPLRRTVRAAIQSMSATRDLVVQSAMALKIDGENRAVRVIVAPLIDNKSNEGICVVAFQDVEQIGQLTPAEVAVPAPDVQALSQELRTTRTQLQAAIDDFESATEEMKSTNEEYQSVNEELQSANEELETSKEEMQSINEELQTVNEELTLKNDQLRRLNSDFKNLLDSTEIATIFLTEDLRIKSFTPGMTKLFHLRDTDCGRPITDIATVLSSFELRLDVKTVLSKLTMVEREVQIGESDAVYLMRMRPYRTVDNVIEGVVVTYFDISERKKAEKRTALLMGELDHRVKNILAVVSSVISQTIRTNPSSADEIRASLEGRIRAIARAHSLVANRAGIGEASLHEIIAVELEPYELEGTKLIITGTKASLTSKAAMALAIVIHELASNAAKYGALSTPGGQLRVKWGIVGAGENRTLNLVWEETGGPPVQPPSRRGFGSELIEKTLAHEFDAIVNREFRPAGLRCTIEIPLVDDSNFLSASHGDVGEQ